jgi:hypothetical protein
MTIPVIVLVLIVPMLCVGMQPVTLRVTGRRASLEAFPRGSVGTISGGAWS